MEVPSRRRWLKWFAVGLAALAVAQGVRVFSTMNNTVRMSYLVPPGDLAVIIFDVDGQRLRRTQFGANVRQHELQLPEGSYTAELTPADLPPVRRDFVVQGDGVIELNYR